MQELGGDAVEGGLARRVFASEFLNQPAGKQLAHGMAAVHPAQGVYLGLGDGLFVGDNRERLQRGAGEAFLWRVQQAGDVESIFGLRGELVAARQRDELDCAARREFRLQRMQGSLHRFGRRACRLAERLQAQRRVRHEQQRVQHILQVWLWHHGVYTPCWGAFLPARGILQGVKTMPTATARPRRKRLTEHDLLQMPSDGRKYELVDGRLQIVPTGARHGEIVSNLIGRLHTAKTPTVALYSEAVGFRMRSGNIRSPDASVMRRERLPDGVSPDEFIDGAPDLAVEVVSPSTRTRDTVEKVRLYHQAGIAWYWLIDSETLAVQELRWTPDGYVIGAVATAGQPFCPAALPGFEIDLQAALEE